MDDDETRQVDAEPEFRLVRPYVAALNINEMYPFREGNGRTQRAFLRQLAVDAGYQVDWVGVDVHENITTAVEAHQGNLDPLARLFNRIVTPSDR